MVSFIELSRLSRDTGEILGANQRNIELAGRCSMPCMHRTWRWSAVLSSATAPTTVSAGRVSIVSKRRCSRPRRRLSTSRRSTRSPLRRLELRVMTDNFLASGADASAGAPAAALPADSLRRSGADSLGSRWYNETYEAQYDKLISAINNYMTSAQGLAGSAGRTDEDQRLPGRYAGADLARGNDCHRADALLLHSGLTACRPSNA